MRTRPETGLSEADYDTFVDAVGMPRAFEVVAHKSNLDFTELTTDTGVIGNDDKDFTVAHVGNYVYRLSGGELERFDLDTEEWYRFGGLFTLPANSLVTAPAIVPYSDNSYHLAVYVPTTYGLMVSHTYDGGFTWTTWTTFYGGNQNQSVYSTNLVRGSYLTSITAQYPSTGNYLPNNVREDYAPAVGTDMWTSSDYNTTGWFQITFNSGRRITKYSIKGRNAFLDQNISSWRLQRHNGTAWETMHTVTGATWLPNEVKTYVLNTLSEGIPAYTPSTQWRIMIDANGGNIITAIVEIQMFETVAGTAVPDIVRVSAPAQDRIHMVYKNQSKQIYNLRVAHQTGADTWAINVSDIWWTFDMGDFGVVTKNDEDVIVFTSEVPGTLTILNQGNQPVKHIYTMGGLLCFKYKYGSWSDHISIEVVDNVEYWRYRDNSRVAIMNGLFVATCYSSDGTENYPLEGYRYYTSKDGKFWSNGNLMPMDEPDSDSGFGLCLAQHGDYVYGFERQRVYRSYSVYGLGYSPESQQIDITDRLEDYSFSQDGAFQAGMLLENSDGWLDEHPILSPDNTVTFVHKSGYWLPDAGDSFKKVLIQVGVTQLDSFEPDEQMPETLIRITARDNLQYVTDLISSEQARYFKSQIIGANNFTDTGDTNYGGLSHTATQAGAFKTSQNWLEVDVSSKEAIAFSTFITDLWNGSSEMVFRLSSTSTTQNAGVVFRAVDTENMWFALWEASTNRIKLVERRQGVDYTRSTMASSIGWTIANVNHWMRVEFRYAQIKVYFSNDGRVWTLALEHLISCETRTYGSPYLKRVVDVPLERGYTGQIGKGVK